MTSSVKIQFVCEPLAVLRKGLLSLLYNIVCGADKKLFVLIKISVFF